MASRDPQLIATTLFSHLGDAALINAQARLSELRAAEDAIGEEAWREIVGELTLMVSGGHGEHSQ